MPKYNQKHIILTALLPFWYTSIFILKKHPDFIETYYSNGIYPIISLILRTIFGCISFSIGDLILLGATIFLTRTLYSILKHKFSTFITEFLKIGAILSISIFLFYLFWGLNYFRIPLGIKLGYSQEKYTNSELLKTTQRVVFKLNKTHCDITKNDTIEINFKYTNDAIFKKAYLSYQNLEKYYPIFKYPKPIVKTSLISILQSYNGIQGYINPLTGEAQVNNMIPKISKPITTTHEIAHQIGWNAENEANFIGFLAANYSDDIYFKYSSYRMAFRYLIAEVKKREPKYYNNIWSTLNKGIIKDFNKSHKHWEQFKNPVEPYIKSSYNIYLKANNQQKGINSYNYVVDLLINYYKKIN